MILGDVTWVDGSLVAGGTNEAGSTGFGRIEAPAIMPKSPLPRFMVCDAVSLSSPSLFLSLGFLSGDEVSLISLKTAAQWESASLAASRTRQELSLGPSLSPPLTQSFKAFMVSLLQQQPRFRASAAS